MGFTAVQKAVAIVPKISASMSFLGSLYILQDVVRDKKKRSSSMYHRIMFGLSLMDAIGSSMMILSTWPSPRYLSEQGSVYGAVGNETTCVLQGAIAEMGFMATPIYTTGLCVRYMLQIRYNVKDSILKKYEILFHIIPISIGLTMGLAGLYDNTYNNAGFNCWYAPYPPGCHTTGDCTRGTHAAVFRWVHFSLIWGAIALVFLCMVLIFLAVYHQERKATFLADFTFRRPSSVKFSPGAAPAAADASGDSFDEETPTQTPRACNRWSILSVLHPSAAFSAAPSSSGEGGRQRQNRRKKKTVLVARQAFYYIGCLYLTWFFTTLVRIFQISRNETYTSLILLMAVFFPMQGFFNAFIYARPNLKKWTALVRCSKKESRSSADHTSNELASSHSLRHMVEEQHKAPPNAAVRHDI